MSELPDNWEQCEIGDVAQIVSGGTPSTKDPTNFADDGGIPWITPSDLSGYNKIYISHGARNLSEKGFETCSASKLPAGSVLFSSRAPIGYVAIAANELTTNQGFKSFVLTEDLDSRFIYYYLRYAKPIAEAMATGTTFKELSGSKASRLPLLVAPLPEQKRIADKLGILLTRLDVCKIRIERVRLILERLRLSVLATATSGMLTEDWRKERNKSKQYRLVSLEETDSDFRYGSSAKSQPSGIIPVLRMGNIKDGKLDWENLVFTSDENEIKKYRLSPGDVLFNRTNSPELVGKTAVFKGSQPAIYAGYLIRIRCGNDLLPDYLSYYLNSPTGRDWRWRVKSDSVSQSNINAKKLAGFQLELPPVEEQREIVRRVEALLAFADRLDIHLQATQTLIDRLEPALLSKAFSGKLVSQNPNDEQASVLVERIRAERAAMVSKPKKVSSSSKPKRIKMSDETVKKLIGQLPGSMFSFDELRDLIPGDYDKLKDIVFALLGESESGITQVFDETSQAMRFIRGKK